MSAQIGLRLESTANLREPWQRRAKRAQEHRFFGRALGKAAGARPLAPGERATITITRVAPRALDDDNLASCAKAVRDGVADALGVPDNDRRLSWAYAQRRGATREYGVEVAIVFACSRESGPPIA